MTRRRHIQDERAPRTRPLRGESLPEPPPWMAEALCAQADPDLWFPDHGESARTRAAVAVCKGCPVRTACATYIFTIDPRGRMEGVWGALSQTDRQRIARRAALTSHGSHNPVANCARCGRPRTLGKKPARLCRDCLYVEPDWPEISPDVNSEGIQK